MMRSTFCLAFLLASLAPATHHVAAANHANPPYATREENIKTFVAVAVSIGVVVYSITFSGTDFLFNVISGLSLGAGLSGCFGTLAKRKKQEPITLFGYVKQAGVGGVSGGAVALAGTGVGCMHLGGIASAAIAGAVGGGVGGLVKGALDEGIPHLCQGHGAYNTSKIFFIGGTKRAFKGALVGAASGSAAMFMVITTSNMLEEYDVAYGWQKAVNIASGVVGGAVGGGISNALISGCLAPKGNRIQASCYGALAGGLSGVVLGGVVGNIMTDHVAGMKYHIAQAWHKPLSADTHINHINISDLQVKLSYHGDALIQEHISYHTVSHREYDLNINIDAYNTIHNGNMHTAGTIHTQGTGYVTVMPKVVTGKDVNQIDTFTDTTQTRIDLHWNIVGFTIRHHIDLPKIQIDAEEGSYVIALATLAHRDLEDLCDAAENIGAQDNEEVAGDIPLSTFEKVTELVSLVANRH